MRSFALIMAGGEGSRLYPLSTPEQPKQFLDLYGGASLLAQTYARIRPLFEPQDVFVATSHRYAHWVKEQIPEISSERLILESHKKNTAPAIALAAGIFASLDEHSVMGVFPSDHFVGQEEEFRAGVRHAFSTAREQPKLIIGGVRPAWPSTEYGYIKVGRKIPGTAAALYEVRRFVEKPDETQAKGYCEGGYLWHSGPFIWRSSVILREIARHLPGLHVLLGQVTVEAGRVRQSRADRFFTECENISIDHGVLEHSREVWVWEGDYGWSDLGSFEALRVIQKGVG